MVVGKVDRYILKNETRPSSYFFNVNLVFYFFFYCCSSTVVSIFTPPQSPTPSISASHPWTYLLWLCPCVLYTCSLVDFPLFSPIIPLPPPLWLLSICSLFQWFWLYFACFIFCFYFLKLFYYCSSTVVCIYPYHSPPTPTIPTSLACFHPPSVLSMCPL